MAMSLHALAVESFAPMLHALSLIIGKAEAFRYEKKLDESALPNARLAPDMYPLTMQVEIACEHANEAMRQLGGVPFPKLEKQDVTLADLRARIDTTVAHLNNVAAA